MNRGVSIPTKVIRIPTKTLPSHSSPLPSSPSPKIQPGVLLGSWGFHWTRCLRLPSRQLHRERGAPELLGRAEPAGGGQRPGPRASAFRCGAVVVKAVLVDSILVGIGELTTHFRTYFGGDWDVHWRYDLDFDPWPWSRRFRGGNLLALKQDFSDSTWTGFCGLSVRLRHISPE